jgi:type I restriction enzyme, S subunit
MDCDWKTLHLGDCVTYQKGFPFKSADYRTSGHPIVRVSNFSDRSIDLSECTHLSHDEAPQYEAYELRFLDVVIATVGSWPTNPDSVVGKCICVPKKAEGTLLNQNAVRLRAKSDIDQRFLFYVLKRPDFQTYIVGNAQGSASQASITLNDIFGFKFQCPRLGEQKAIANVLGALDDKIELNRRMNATLEAMARALFQSWFVDFDPVRAKVDGRKPVGIDAATAALLPATFQKSHFGPIPKGWEIITLSDLTSCICRGIGPSYLEAGGTCVLNQKCVRGHRVDFTKSRRHDSTKKSVDGRALQVHDILVNSTGMGTLGRVAQLFHLPEPTTVDSHITIVRANSDTDALFLGLALTGRENEIEALGEGSTGQTELSRTRLGELKIIAPPPSIQRAFGAVVRPLLLSISENAKQTHSLANLRDTLLPKLLSGEIRVSAAEKFVESSK